MEPEGSVPHSQQLSTFSYPEPVHTTPSCLRKINTNLRLCLSSGLFPLAFLSLTFVLHAQRISYWIVSF
jgi:hypothetical protein